MAETRTPEQRSDGIRAAVEQYYRRTGSKAESATEEEKRAEYSRLVTLGRAKGFRPGWAAYQWKALFGAWPPREWGQAPGSGASPGVSGTRSAPEYQHADDPGPEAVQGRRCPTCGRT